MTTFRAYCYQCRDSRDIEPTEVEQNLPTAARVRGRCTACRRQGRWVVGLVGVPPVALERA